MDEDDVVADHSRISLHSNISSARSDWSLFSFRESNKIVPVSDEYASNSNDSHINVEKSGTKVKDSLYAVKETPKVTRKLDYFGDYWKAFSVLLFHRHSCQTGLMFSMAGLAVSFIVSIFSSSPGFDCMIVLVLLASSEFNYFPINSIRSYIAISCLTCVSILLDLWFIIEPATDPKVKILTGVVLCTKMFVFYYFLRCSSARSTDAQLAKKIMNRRLRVFTLSFSKVPYRLMREIRNRLVALGILHVVAGICYLVLFSAALTMTAESAVTSPVTGISFGVFTLIKFFTSVIFAVAIVIDTDIVLALGNFGCLGMFMKYYRSYVATQRNLLYGWPLIYAFSTFRVQFLYFFKLMDALFGFLGWINLFGTAGKAFLRARYDVKGYLISVGVVLFVCDEWALLLFLNIKYYIKKLKKLRGKVSGGYNESWEDSDDSELDELKIRDDADRRNDDHGQDYGDEEGHDGDYAGDDLESGVTSPMQPNPVSNTSSPMHLTPIDKRISNLPPRNLASNIVDDEQSYVEEFSPPPRKIEMPIKPKVHNVIDPVSPMAIADSIRIRDLSKRKLRPQGPERSDDFKLVPQPHLEMSQFEYLWTRLDTADELSVNGVIGVSSEGEFSSPVTVEIIGRLLEKKRFIVIAFSPCDVSRIRPGADIAKMFVLAQAVRAVDMKPVSCLIEYTLTYATRASSISCDIKRNLKCSIPEPLTVDYFKRQCDFSNCLEYV